MFWLFEKSNKLNFLQIFPYYNKYEDCGAGCVNLIYDFTINNVDIPEFNNIEPIEISYTISIKDNYIQYFNNDEILTWQFDNEFVKENDDLNNCKFPFFKWNYILVDNHKIPNVSIKNYDFHYPKAMFKIYKISKNKLFVIEQINDIIKKYILEKN